MENNNDLEKMRQVLGEIKSKVQQGQYFFEKTETVQFDKVVEYCEVTGARLLIVIHELERIVNLLAELENMRAKALVMPKASIKILRFLPLVSLGLAAVFGANIWTMFTTLQGIACVSLGIIFWIIGEHITNKMITDFDELGKCDFFYHPLVQLVLVKSAVLTGLDMLSAMRALQIEGVQNLERGLPFMLAKLPLVFNCLETSYKTGISPIGPIDAKIDSFYNSELRNFTKKGEELAVKLTVPLGSCYLPSFILIGVIPTIIALL